MIRLSMGKIVAGLLGILVIAWAAGFGVDVGTQETGLAHDALISGVEALVAAFFTALGGWWALQYQAKKDAEAAEEDEAA